MYEALEKLAGRDGRITRLWAWAFGSVPLLAAFVLINVSPAAAATVTPTVPSGFTITKVSDIAAPAANCDDLAFLAGNLFVGCQDKTLSNGAGGNSTLVEFTPSGSVVNTWSIKYKIDGMSGDPLRHRVIVTLNEDANTHLATITPSAAAGQQVTYYNYTPDIRATSTPPALRPGGGTDHVAVDSVGNILITASHASNSTGTAVFKVVLTPPSSPTGTGVASLSPTFLDNAVATNATGSGLTKLSLGDVDSAAIVPKSSPRFGGSFVITDQTALQLVFSNDIFKGTGLTVLKAAFGLDDLLWATSPGGTLYVVDKGPTVNLPKVSASALWKVTGPFTTNTVLATNDGAGDQVVTVNLTNGKLTPLIQHLQTAKGLVYLNPDGTQTQLSLNGATAVPVSGSGTQTSSSTATQVSSGSSNTALIVIIIVVVLLVIGGGAYAMMRRRPAT
ncbi:MAG TPA: hypothetical protein VIX82_05680 [Solirubrobacteraceae bacterium]